MDGTNSGKLATASHVFKPAVFTSVNARSSASLLRTAAGRALRIAAPPQSVKTLDVRQVQTRVERPSISRYSVTRKASLHQLRSMLQINTGKFFGQGTGRTNQLRGVLYCNINPDSWQDDPIQSELFGRLLHTSSFRSAPASLVYEFDERLERGDRTPGTIFSHGVEPYLEEMATVVSFGLNCTCSTDIDVVRRLTGESSTSLSAPSRHVKRVFNKTVYCRGDEARQFVRFAEKLLSLKRSYYLAAMSAIRTYVAGLRRIADDVDVAYTMLVAACESLAEGTNSPTPTWESLDSAKRSRFDEALAGAPSEVATATRNAVLFFEHTALSRKFQQFVMGHIEPEYFHPNADVGEYPVGRSDLREVLQAAYGIRSKYVHKLAPLPQAMSMGLHTEMTLVDRRMTLTLQGFARLARHVITSFVHRCPSVDEEAYSYVSELHGVIRARFGGAEWVASLEGNLAGEGRVRLEAFLEALEAVLMRRAGAKLPDVREVLKFVAERGDNMPIESKRAYWALQTIFNAVVPQHAVLPTAKQSAQLERDVKRPSVEALLASAFGEPVPWELNAHLETLRGYFAQRGHQNGVRAPRLLEAAITLELGERFRKVGDLRETNRLLLEAADNFPDCVPLRALAEAPLSSIPVCWHDIMLPSAN